MAPETGTNDGTPELVVPSISAPLYLSQEASERATGTTEEVPKLPAIIPGHLANAFTFGGYLLLQCIPDVACPWCCFSVSAPRGGSCRLAQLLAQVWWGSGPANATRRKRSLTGWDSGPVGGSRSRFFRGTVDTWARCCGPVGRWSNRSGETVVSLIGMVDVRAYSCGLVGQRVPS